MAKVLTAPDQERGEWTNRLCACQRFNGILSLVGLVVVQLNTSSVLFLGFIESDWTFCEFNQVSTWCNERVLCSFRDQSREISCQWTIYNYSIGDENLFWIIFRSKFHQERFVELFNLGRRLAEKKKDTERETLERILMIANAFGSLGTRGIAKNLEDKFTDKQKKGRNGSGLRWVYGGVHRIKNIFRTS